MALHDVRICTFPAFLQDRSQVMTATVTVGTRTMLEGLIWPRHLRGEGAGALQSR